MFEVEPQGYSRRVVEIWHFVRASGNAAATPSKGLASCWGRMTWVESPVYFTGGAVIRSVGMRAELTRAPFRRKPPSHGSIKSSSLGVWKKGGL